MTTEINTDADDSYGDGENRVFQLRQQLVTDVQNVVETRDDVSMSDACRAVKHAYRDVQQLREANE